MSCPSQSDSILNGWLYHRGPVITVRCISLNVLMVWGSFLQILRESIAVANTGRKSRLAPGDPAREAIRSLSLGSLLFSDLSKSREILCQEAKLNKHGLLNTKLTHSSQAF